MEIPKYVVKAFILKEVKYHGTAFVYEETEAIPIEWIEEWLKKCLNILHHIFTNVF